MENNMSIIKKICLAGISFCLLTGCSTQFGVAPANAAQPTNASVSTPAPESVTYGAGTTRGREVHTATDTTTLVVQGTSREGAGRVQLDSQGITIVGRGRGGSGTVAVGTGGVQVQGGTANIQLGSNLQSVAQIDLDEVIEINGASLERVYQCGGQTVEVNGTSHDLVLEGRVGHLEVNGTNNRVHVENANTIDANGVNNVVTWSGDRPAVSIAGINNSVSQR
jgi:hypothetical protein